MWHDVIFNKILQRKKQILYIICSLITCMYSYSAYATDLNFYSAPLYSTAPKFYMNMPVGSFASKLSGAREEERSDEVEGYIATDRYKYQYSYYFDVDQQISWVTLFLEVCKTNTLGISPEEKNRTQQAGLCDPAVMYNYTFWGSPALDPKEFRAYELDSSLVLSFKLIAPYGDYSNTNELNIGENMWQMTAEIAYNFTLGRYFEINFYNSLTGFLANDDYINPATDEVSHLSSDVLYNGQLYASYTIKNVLWTSLGVRINQGGNKYVNEASIDDGFNQTYLFASFNVYASQKNVLTLSYDTLINDPNDESLKRSMISFEWSHFFGSYNQLVK